GLDERAAVLAHHYEACGDQLEAARWHGRAAAWAEVTSPADAMHHWRLVRRLTTGLEGGELAANARIGLLGMAWRLGMVPDEAAALHAEGASVEQFRLDLNYAATLMHGGREQEGLELFREVNRRAVATGDPELVLTPACGLSYSNWIAGTLTDAVAVIDEALRLANGNPTAGAGLAFVSPYAHAFGHRGQALGYMGELDEARRDFDRGIELAREHGDPEVESYHFANLALLEAIIGDTEAALRDATLGLEIANRAGNAIAIIALSTPRPVAQAGWGRFARGLGQAEPNLEPIRHHRWASTTSRCSWPRWRAAGWRSANPTGRSPPPRKPSGSWRVAGSPPAPSWPRSRWRRFSWPAAMAPSPNRPRPFSPPPRPQRGAAMPASSSPRSIASRPPWPDCAAIPPSRTVFSLCRGPRRAEPAAGQRACQRSTAVRTAASSSSDWAPEAPAAPSTTSSRVTRTPPARGTKSPP